MFNIYNYQHLPVIDFRPYKTGNNINALMKPYNELSDKIPAEKEILDKIPANKAYDIYKTTYFYKKNGVIKTFTKIPDSSWTWIKTENILISEGYHPPIHDFSISNKTEGDITNKILNDTALNILIISYKIDKANFNGLLSVCKYAIDAFNKNGTKSYFLTASLNNDIEKLKDTLNVIFGYNSSNNNQQKEYIYYYEKNGEIESFTSGNLPNNDEWTFVDKEIIENTTPNKLPFNFYETDETTLKTIIRANPGIVFIKNGTIVGKKHYNMVFDGKYF